MHTPRCLMDANDETRCNTPCTACGVQAHQALQVQHKAPLAMMRGTTALLTQQDTRAKQSSQAIHSF